MSYPLDRALQVAVQELDRIQLDVASFGLDGDDPLVDWSQDGAETVRALLTELPNAPSPEAAWAAVAAVGAFAAQFDSLFSQAAARDPDDPATTGGSGGGVWTKLKNALSSLKAQVWSIVASLSTPTSWKLTGGVGAVLGIASASVEISFG